VQRRNVAQVDPGDGQRAAPVECAQRDRHEFAGRREKDRGVERRRWLVVGVARGRGAKREGKLTSGGRSGHDVDGCSLVQRHLSREVSRRAEAVDAECPAAGKRGAA